MKDNFSVRKKIITYNGNVNLYHIFNYCLWTMMDAVKATLFMLLKVVKQCILYVSNKIKWSFKV